MTWPPDFIHSKIATTLGGYHSTTRGTIQLVFPQEGKWLVFRGDPDTYHFSEDGITWIATEAPQVNTLITLSISRFTFHASHSAAVYE